MTTDIIDFEETCIGGVEFGGCVGDFGGKADGIEELVGEG